MSKLSGAIQGVAFADLVEHLPPPPSTTATFSDPGDLGSQLFCGVSAVQVGHGSSITNNYVYTSMASDGTWSFVNTASSLDTRAASCISGAGAGNVQFFSTSASMNITNALFCAITDVQNGWNSPIGNYAGFIRPSSVPYTWTFTNEAPRQVVQHVGCVMRSPATTALLPGWSAVSYHDTLGDIGTHFFCALAGVQTGYQTNIGNQVTAVSGKPFGPWTLSSGPNACSTCHAAVCIG